MLATLAAVALGLSMAGDYAGLWGDDDQRSARADWDEDDDEDDEDDTRDEDDEAGSQARRADPPTGDVPKETQVERVGELTVIDVGHGVDTLAGELMRLRREAIEDGERVMVMTVTGDCEPCAGVAESLSDPLMQDALEGIRVVRVDLKVFTRELDELSMLLGARPGGIGVYPGYFLLSPDLTPEDAIDGGEWGEDIAPNIAPVLAPFVRGELDYDERERPYRPRRGIRL